MPTRCWYFARTRTCSGIHARDQVREAEKLHNLGRLDEAIDAYTRAAELDPSLSRALEGVAALTEQQQASKREGPFGQPITMRFQKAGIKEVLEGLAKAAGFNVVFDKDVRSDPISISRADYDEAVAHMVANSVPIREDREQAWRDYAGWRVNYDAVLLGLAELTLAPYAPWSSDRGTPKKPSGAAR